MVPLDTINGYYTTEGQNIIRRETGEVVQLRGIGLGGWLLPEGYMWGIRVLDRPRQFEAAIIDLIGEEDAARFWDLYYRNFVTRSDVEIMKSWGVNTLRVPLLAAMLQPRDGQPSKPPYQYSEENFKYLDAFVGWCEELEMGIIWDMHGAPGGQNAENISDSDGIARLWTEKEIYWPRTIDLWNKITQRYAENECIVGYDLLNEPLLARYHGVDPALLRELYVLLSQTIRETDSEGIIFIEGDEWAQDFTPLEPLDWDPHLVLAFHSYPPTYHQNGLQRWDDLRQRYDIPLWHGETGEQDPPWTLYRRSTEFLEANNVGWNWWTHKKFALSRQPWSIYRTRGFQKILAYWKGEGERPSRTQAKRWLFHQARRTNTIYCEFFPGMVGSLHPLDPSDYAATIERKKPTITEQSQDQVFEMGYPAAIQVKASGYPLKYQWYKNGTALPQAVHHYLAIHHLPLEKRDGTYHVVVKNEKGEAKSRKISVRTTPFEGPEVSSTQAKPVIDASLEPTWDSGLRLSLDNVIAGSRDATEDLGGWASLLYDETYLYVFIKVYDDVISTNSSVAWMNDGIEIYVDADNSKSFVYGEDEFQLRYVVDSQNMNSDIGRTVPGTQQAQQRNDRGYQMELAIPWSGISTTSQVPVYLGFDIHVNDNDSSTRNGKLSWYASRDNSYQTPSAFGTLCLK